jgi:1,4-dihydroxy-2-naphthoate octaprenyltransferase
MNFHKLTKLPLPLHLVLISLAYVLGAGISRYLGYAVHLGILWLGFLVVVGIQTASFWLNEYFQLSALPLENEESWKDRNTLRAMYLQFAFALLTVIAVIIFVMILANYMSLSVGILLIMIMLFLFAYATPPMRMSDSGYGELVLALTWGTLVPAWAFLLQHPEFHRLLTFVSFPLTLLALAYLLAYDFPSYSSDLKLSHQSLLIRLSWQYAVPIHHILILVAFLFFGISSYLGFPWSLAWPVFLVLPFAVLQVIWLQRIASGGRTIWKFFTTLSLATVGLTMYLLAFTFWTR